MRQFEMTNLERLNLKRKAAKKRRKIMVIIFVVALALILCSLFVIFSGSDTNTGISLNIFKKELNAKTLQPPEYVDVQLIHNGFARTGVKINEINNIVIHYVGNPGTTAQNNRDYFDKVDTNVCSHFVIGLDGEIIQCIPLDEKSNASNNRNLDTISIEVCHPDDTGKFNEDTYDSLVKLTAWLCDNSGLDEEDVIRHYDITGKVCPKYFVENESAWYFFKKDIQLKLDDY